MTKKPSIAILYHIFYEDSCASIPGELQALSVYEPVFLFNICSQTPDKRSMYKMLREAFPDCIIITTSNKGKDIGAKLALIQLLFELDIEATYLLFLHDKKSLQALKHRTWKNDLLKIILSENVPTILKFFIENKNCGMVATREYIIEEPFDENHFTGINGPVLEEILRQYSIKPANTAFVAGTMFWAKADPIKKFFTRYNPLAIRKQLENGNVIDNFSGTITHSWERMLSWIVTGNGFYIQGI